MIPSDHIIIPKDLYDIFLKTFLSVTVGRSTPPPPPATPEVVVNQPSTTVSNVPPQTTNPSVVPGGYTSTGADEEADRVIAENE